MTDREQKTPTWALRDQLTLEATIAKLEDMATAAYSCARTTTDVDVRAGTMDRCHVLREAARLLRA